MERRIRSPKGSVIPRWKEGWLQAKKKKKSDVCYTFLDDNLVSLSKYTSHIFKANWVILETGKICLKSGEKNRKVWLMPSAREHCLRTQKDPQTCPTAFFLKARDSSHMAGLHRPCSSLTGQESRRRVTQDWPDGAGLGGGPVQQPQPLPWKGGGHLPVCVC